MKPWRLHSGFTIVELLVVIAVISIMAVLSANAFRSMYQSSTIRAGANEVYGALAQARVDTLAAQNNSVHGVHISSTTVTRFEGSTYTPGSSSNKIYVFEGSVFATSSIISGGGTIIFSRLIGKPSRSGLIYVVDAKGSGTSTIRIHDSGLVEFN